MLKKFLLFAIFMAFCFMIPSFFIDFPKNTISNSDAENTENDSGEVLKTDNKQMLKLLLTESNQIVELEMDDYIKGVVLR